VNESIDFFRRQLDQMGRGRPAKVDMAGVPEEAGPQPEPADEEYDTEPGDGDLDESEPDAEEPVAGGGIEPTTDGLIAWALEDPDVDGLDYLGWACGGATPAEWMAAAREAGWPVDARPSFSDLPTEIRVALIQRGFDDKVAAARESRR
jgi:hypothetical protein